MRHAIPATPFIRRAFLSLKSLDNIDYQDVMVKSRALYFQAGGDPHKINKMTVKNEKSKIKNKIGKFDREAIEKFQLQASSRSGLNSPSLKVCSNGESSEIVKLSDSIPDWKDNPLSLVEMLKLTKSFCARVGGCEQALQLVNAIKEIVK